MTEWQGKQLLGKLRDSARSVGPIIGVTVDTLTEVIDLDVRQFRDTEFVIANTGSNTLHYDVRVRSEYTTEPEFTVFSNTILPGAEDEIILVRHSRIFIYIQSYVLGQSTAYSISGMGGT